MVTMEKANDIAGMELASDEDFEHDESTPRLPVLSTPPWGFHSEPPGMTTPPLNNLCSSVPFEWEEVPGKPKHQQEKYCLTPPVFTWNDYQDNDFEIPFTKPKAKRAKRGFLISLKLLDCMTYETLENYDVDTTEYKPDTKDLRVIDGLVGGCTSWPCPPFPTPTFFVPRRRKRREWVVRKLCKSSRFFVSMCRRGKRVVL